MKREMIGSMLSAPLWKRACQPEAGKGRGKGNKKGLAVSEALLFLSGGAGRDRTDDLMNAIFFTCGSVQKITY